jgi:hypothetical protein
MTITIISLLQNETGFIITGKNGLDEFVIQETIGYFIGGAFDQLVAEYNSGRLDKKRLSSKRFQIYSAVNILR